MPEKSVWQEFKSQFMPKLEMLPEPEPDVLFEEAKARVESVRDMRIFVSTQAYKDYRAWLDREIDTMSPDPSKGTDVAACYTFMREGLIVSRKRLDTMVKLAEEKLSNG